MDWTSCAVVESNPEIMSGAPVITGTRIPVAAIFENIEGGASIQDIVSWFPGIAEEQIREVLRFTAKSAAA